jgi:iron complex outermembrane recepter protein
MNPNAVAATPAGTAPAARAVAQALPAGALISALLTIAHPALAEAPAESDTALQEIVVTATKRTENLQDVPLAVSVLTGDALDKAGAIAYSDYLVTIPSVSYVTQGNGRDRINIRGVSSLPGDLGLSTTGVYIDEAPVSEVNASLANLDTFDLERVEVLRGPQGTLFGAGAMGGAVRLILQKPQLDETSGVASVSGSETEHGGENYDAHAVLNAPVITDQVGLRIMVGDHHDAGFIDDPGQHRDDVNSHNQSSARLLLLAKPVDELSVLLTGLYQRDTTGGNPFADVGLGPYQQLRLYPEPSKYQTRLVGLTINYDMGFATLTSATDYLDKSNFFAQDFTSLVGGFAEQLIGAPLASTSGIGLQNGGYSKVFSQEVRLASRQEGRIRWLAGAFYSRQRVLQTQAVDTHLAPELATAGNFLFASSALVYEQTAGFGEVNFLLTKDLTLTGGVRVAHFTTDDTEFSDGYLGVGGPPVAAKSSDTKSTPKVTLSYELTSRNEIYATASQGYRVGGPNGPIPTSICGADLAALGLTAAPSKYDPDTIWNYELGSKNRLFDDRATVNAAAYHINWSGIQVSRGLDCGFDFGGNAGSAIINGGELEIAARVLPQFTVGLSGSYTDAKFTSSVSDAGVIEGSRVPGTTRYTYDVFGEYRFHPLGHESFARAEFQRVGDEYNGLESSKSTRLIPAYGLLNLRMGVAAGPWSFELFARNALDSRAVIYERVTDGLNYDELAQPRTIGLQAQFRF